MPKRLRTSAAHWRGREKFSAEKPMESGVLGLVKREPVAIEVARQELIGRAPQIKPELAELEIAEAALYVLLVRFEIERPLLEGEEIAPAIVLHFHQLELGLGELVEQIVE